MPLTLSCLQPTQAAYKLDPVPINMLKVNWGLKALEYTSEIKFYHQEVSI